MSLALTIISSIALLLIALTMLARANDLGSRPGVFWMVRRIGFVLSGFSPFAIIYFDWQALILEQVTVTWWHVLFRCGLACVFVTTPYLPPWWKWFFGLDGGDVKWSDDRRGMPHRRRTDDDNDGEGVA